VTALHPLAELVLARVVEKDGALLIDDKALVELARAYGEHLVPERAEAATVALLETAMFLDVQRQSPDASGTLLTLVFAAAPALRAIDAAAAKVVDEAQAKLAAFRGDERVTKVLDTGARPEGTVAASPLARFQMQVPRKK
jgi:hypothetical protein